MSYSPVSNRNSAIIPYTPRGMAFIKQEVEKAETKAFKQALTLDRASLNLFSTESLVNRVSSFDEFPDEVMIPILLELFFKHGPEALAITRRADKRFKRLADFVFKQNIEEYLGKKVFGKKSWEKYFGDIGEVPPLPQNIDKILNSPCPFSKSGEKVKDTQMLVLIPETINGEHLTINKLGEFLKQYFPDNKEGYRYIWKKIVEQYGKDGKNQSE